MVNDKIVNDLVMKKQYISPLTEAQTMKFAIGIMKTSIDPLSDPGLAPRRADMKAY